VVIDDRAWRLFGNDWDFALDGLVGSVRHEAVAVAAGDDEMVAITLEEAETLFPLGSVVRLKSDGPDMTVVGVGLEKEGVDNAGVGMVSVDCMWFEVLHGSFTGYPLCSAFVPQALMVSPLHDEEDEDVSADEHDEPTDD
jgi:uncharacterized protein YodC (DUF2158 family)